MRVLLVLGLLASSLAGVSAGCLAACNDGMSICLTQCPKQCPTDPACMQTCFDSCTAEEQDCAMKCHTPLHSAFNQIKSAMPAPAAAAAAVEAKPMQLAALSEAHYQGEFTSFVRRHKKVYPSDEFFARYHIFKANYNFIRTHTAEKKRTYTVAVNEFADMTFEEFHAKMTGYKAKDHSVLRASNNQGPHKDIEQVASALDWRAKNAVTGVKNQQQCGSCWAFSTTGSTEGAHAIKTGKLVSLSEQQLVDCSTAQGNQGCNGGLMDQGFQYIISNKGITTEEAYPYTAADGTCKTGQKAAATLSSFVDVAAGDEKDLLRAINVGPVSVAIEADQQCFQFYSGGVMSDPSCGQQLDHGVLVVAYGTDAGQDYWTIKNSWGATWGESGYIRIARNAGNMCGVASSASYPVV